MKVNYDPYLVMTEKLLKLTDSLSYYEELRTTSELMRKDIISVRSRLKRLKAKSEKLSKNGVDEEGSEIIPKVKKNALERV
mgnify:CR=1 FL=1